jgi:N-methylhydantoinase B
MKFLVNEGKLTNLAERQRFSPYGLFGGKPGKLGRTVVNPGPSERVIHAKESCEFEYGDVISFQQPGAGGYGDPATRDPAKVLEDVLNDFVSLETAREAYGVVIDSTTWTVDATATERLRATMRVQGTPPVVTR